VGTFYFYQICRPICRPNNRYFGGLAILTKSHITNYQKKNPPKKKQKNKKQKQQQQQKTKKTKPTLL
jgi:hypothetical protein